MVSELQQAKGKHAGQITFFCGQKHTWQNPTRQLIAWFFVKSNSFGGTSGGAFISAINPRGVEKIEIHYHNIVSAIQLTFRDGTQTLLYGKPSQKVESFTVPPQAYINESFVRHGSMVDSLQFSTSTGEKTAMFGGGGGSLSVDKAPAGMELVGIKGRKGSDIDQIAFVWGEPERVTSVELKLIEILHIKGFSLGCGFRSVNTLEGHLSVNAHSTSSVSASLKAAGLLQSVFGNSGISASATASFDAAIQATAEIKATSTSVFAMFLIPTYVYQAKIVVSMSSGDVHEYSGGNIIQSCRKLSVTDYRESF